MFLVLPTRRFVQMEYKLLQFVIGLCYSASVSYSDLCTKHETAPFGPLNHILRCSEVLIKFS